MRVARYWQSARVEFDDGSVSVRRGSMESPEAARALAHAAAEAIAADFERTGVFPESYTYAAATRPEPLIETYEQAGELVAAITINTQGCRVLNTAQLAFVDVDLPAPGTPARLFGRSAERAQEQSVECLRSWIVSDGASMGVHAARVYRTAGGLRYVLPGVMFDPCSDETAAMFDRLGADPKYATLCTVQQSFRARLTPKPTRIYRDHRRWVGVRDSDDPDWQPDPDRMLDYERACEPFATCRHIADVGELSFVDDLTERLVQDHDKETRAFTELPLA